MQPVLLSIGHGYSAAAAASALPQGWRVLATTRNPEKARDLASAGLEAVLWQGDAGGKALGAALAQATHLISSVPPRGKGGAHQGDPVLAALDGLAAPHLRWIGYLSASSVYGDAGGDWLDETAPLEPGTERGKARLAAEHGWQALGAAHGAGVALFRIAGIYGPGRSAITALREGRAHRVVKPGQVFNRIHVADLGRIIAAAALARATGPFNLCDAEPAPPQDVIAHAADLLRIARPPEEPFDGAALSPMARSFYAESKRLRSVRVVRELGVQLAYPDYRAGLAAILQDEA
ncbi:MAG: NAD-dependent epimerase/dehydratase family protein [Pararhodobacter sp.]